ncbi:hypothetical protein RHGRI_022580 [Rhododendron griersonianum]|uniref:Uncharacterized protein n=1 Tax=Rhododendron griersonianum TaxID=479676 RepID=A0AAV6J2J5_9ERIC|nr:hypothetical protein RHGRI_022580 [Rhododendron griersonianum]
MKKAERSLSVERGGMDRQLGKNVIRVVVIRYDGEGQYWIALASVIELFLSFTLCIEHCTHEYVHCIPVVWSGAKIVLLWSPIAKQCLRAGHNRKLGFAMN